MKYGSDRTWRIVGLMSGTSLDGLDIACCEFEISEGILKNFSILKAETVSYSSAQQEQLSLMSASATDLASADAMFGRFCGTQVDAFLKKYQLTADFVASHGHTVFHQPQNGFTTQIGNGAYISAVCQLPVVSDFRTMDVALGGQGAPLVPIGDLQLFREYDYCLNLGGIANVSEKKEDSIVAYDVCPANMVLNFLAAREGLTFDRNGSLAATGTVHEELLRSLNSLSFYQTSAPKSLGKEWFDSCFLPLLTPYLHIATKDLLATLTTHIAEKIADTVTGDKATQLLVTGGGAKNGFLVKILEKRLPKRCTLIVPVEEIIDFKEALVFAFLGLLRVTSQFNALREVTGAAANSVGGALYGDFSRILRSV